MPAVVTAAPAAARAGRRDALRLIAARLLAGVLAAAAGLVAAGHPRLMWLAWVATALFAAALLIEAVRGLTRPDRQWHGSRAVAEAGKSAAWSYAAGAAPFTVYRLWDSGSDVSEPRLVTADGRSATRDRYQHAASSSVGGLPYVAGRGRDGGMAGPAWWTVDDGGSGACEPSASG